GRPHVHQNAHRLFFFARRRRHTRFSRDWSSDVCSSDLIFHLQLSKMQLFYNPDITETTTEFAFPKEESNHIVKVLRKTVGDTLRSEERRVGKEGRGRSMRSQGERNKQAKRKSARQDKDP